MKDIKAREKYYWREVPQAIWCFLGRDKFRYVALNIILFSVLFYELVPPFVVGRVVDFFTHYRPGDSLRTFYLYASLLAVSSIGIAIVRLSAKEMLNRVALNARTRARIWGFERLMEFSLEWHGDENSGNRVQKIFNGSDSIPQWVNVTNNALFPIITAFVGVLGVFLFLSPVFVLFLLLYATSFFSIEYIFNRKLQQLSNEINQYKEQSSGAFIEGAGNVLAIKALGVETDLSAKVKGAEEEVQRLSLQRSMTSTYKWYSFQTLNGISLFIFLYLVAHDFLTGLITVGYILVFFSYFNSLRSATDQAANVSSMIIQYKSDLVRMMPIFRDRNAIQTGNEAFPQDWQEIAITNGYFEYPSGQIGLQNLNFRLVRHRKLGIAGMSGSGKSTLIKILIGLYELQGGSFKVGESNYYDIKHSQVIRNVAVVLQETELFNLSLRDNITFMRNVQPELLARAIEIANLSPVIAKLPQGLDTLIGERGYALSGGERQRLGIARAICKDTPILIFDEATSSLDSKTEQTIMERLLASSEEKTMLIIAHRLSTLREVDTIAVFDNGAVVEEGSFEELERQEGSRFSQLYKLQALP